MERVSDLSPRHCALPTVPLGQADVECAPVRERDLSGVQIGPYRIVRRLGVGGTGVVWLAERADGRFDQRVAIKLVEYRGAPDVARYFDVELRALSRLSHSFIARLYDAGTVDDGLSYFVIEYVNGRRIDDFCRDEQLSLRERLELFRRVCEAVEYAHRNLVIHRDLKPGNILVDDDGNPKLLDFGVAKLLTGLEPAGGPAACVTGKVFTPEYASPEQIAGQPVTTASDVFSLGVVLHELLTGRRFRRLSCADAGWVQEFLDPHPQPPSKLAAVWTPDGAPPPDTPQMTDWPESAVRPRSRRRARRAPHLTDLDMIVLRALRAEPDRRYPSVEQFAEDIRRYLDGLPVLARPDSWRYRTGKVVRRHKVLVASIALGMVGLISTTVGTSIGLVRANRARVEMERQAAIARSAEALAEVRAAQHRHAADRAQQVTVFLQDILTAVNPFSGELSSVTVRQILDDAAVRIPTELGAFPEMEAAVRTTIGNAYAALGLPDPAQEQLGRALALRRQLFGDSDLSVAESLFHAGSIHYDRGHFAAAHGYYTEALDIRRAALGPDHLDVLRIESRLAGCAFHRGEFGVAQELNEHVLGVFRQQFGEDHPRTASCKVELAHTLLAQGRKQAILQLLNGVAEAARDHAAADPMEAMRALGHLADLYVDLGDPMHAESLFRETVDLVGQRFGAKHPRVAAYLGKLARLQCLLGRLDEAEKAASQARELISMHFTEDSREWADLKFIQAGVSWARGDYDVAYSSFQELLDRHLANSPEPSRLLAGMLNSVGVVLRDQGRYDQSAEYLDRALAMALQFYGPDHRYLSNSYNNLARLEYRRGNYEKAEQLIFEALAIRERILPAQNQEIAESKMVLGLILTETEGPAEAESPLREALATRVHGLPPGTWLVAEAESALAGNLIRQHRYSEAEERLLRSLDAVRDTLAPQHVIVQDTLRRLVELYTLAEEPHAAAPYREALSTSAASSEALPSSPTGLGECLARP